MTFLRKATSLIAKACRRGSKVFCLLGWRQTFYFGLHWLLGTPCIALRLRGVPTPLWVRPRDTDIVVLYSAFYLRDCDENTPRPPKTIVDLGANVGFVSVFLANKYPEAKILALELDPGNVEMIRKNTQGYAVEVIEGAIWSEHKHFLIDRGDGRSYQLKVTEVAPETPGSFVSLTIPDLLEKLQTREIDLLKMDIEGAELASFSKGYEEWIDRIGMLIVETHGDEARDAVLAAMSQRGFQSHPNDEKLIFVKP